MTDQELRLVAEIIDRMHLNAAERQVEAVGRVRADSVTLSASYEQRIEALTKALQHERDANRRMSDEVIFQTNSHGKTMVERDGLLTQVQDLRAALEKEQELHAKTALRLSTEAAKMVEQTWKIGDWVKAPLGTRGEIVEIGNEYICVNIPGEQHPMRWWPKHMCTLCDPPAETCAEPDLTQLHAKGKEAWSDVPNATQWVEEMRGNTEATHDTPEGKDVAESVIRDSRSRDINDGDLVEVVSNTGRNTWLADVGSVGTVTSIETINDSISVRLDDVPGKKNVLAGYVSLCDVRKMTA